MTGNELRALRKARKMNQEDLATAIGMPGGQTYISRLEGAGDEEISVMPDTLNKIAGAFGLTMRIILVDPAQEKPAFPLAS